MPFYLFIFKCVIFLIVFAYLHIFAHKKRVSVRFAEIDIFNHILLQEEKKNSFCLLYRHYSTAVPEWTKPEKIEKQCDQSLEQNPE